jgi:hypothetical protein
MTSVIFVPSHAENGSTDPRPLHREQVTTQPDDEPLSLTRDRILGLIDDTTSGSAVVSAVEPTVTTEVDDAETEGVTCTVLVVVDGGTLELELELDVEDEEGVVSSTVSLNV